MELKYLATFQTIVEEGSFTAAAEKLGYTQSTITFQIDQLEQELSVKLFEKVGRKMVLTAAGKELIPHAKEVFAAVERLHYVEKDVSECEGELHIGVAQTYLCYKLPSALKTFVNMAPKAKLYIHSMNCYEIRNQLIEGKLDVGIFYQDIGGYGEGLMIQPLESYPVALVASPNMAEKFSDFTTPDQQHKIPLIINEPNCIFRQIFEQYLKEQRIILDHTIELDSIATIKNLVQNDVGVSFLPKYVVEEELHAGSLVEIETKVEHNELTICYAHHKNKWISPLLRLFEGCLYQKNRTYFMKSEHIGFSKWRAEDCSLAESLWGNPQVTKYICASGTFGQDEIKKRLETEIENEKNYQVQYWPIFELETEKFIGCCGLRPHGKEEYELGFHLLPEFWGRDYAKEAANTAIDYAFHTLHAQALFAGHHPENKFSGARLRSLGFVYTGDSFYEPTGLYHPSYRLQR